MQGFSTGAWISCRKHIPGVECWWTDCKLWAEEISFHELVQRRSHELYEPLESKSCRSGTRKQSRNYTFRIFSSNGDWATRTHSVRPQPRHTVLESGKYKCVKNQSFPPFFAFEINIRQDPVLMCLLCKLKQLALNPFHLKWLSCQGKYWNAIE